MFWFGKNPQRVEATSAESGPVEPLHTKPPRLSQLSTDAGPDFGKARWGFSTKDVMRTLSVPPLLLKEHLLVYESSFAGKKCRTEYHFLKGRLQQGCYQFFTGHLYSPQHEKEYLHLKNYLCDRYHTPKLRDQLEPDQVWLKDTYRQEPDRWTRAITLGHLQYQSVWSPARSKVRLFLQGSQFDVQLGIEYQATTPPVRSKR